MSKFKISSPLTSDLIVQINKLAKLKQVTLIFDNTKRMKISDLQKLDSSVSISILGGLNPTKKKYDTDYYQERTYYSVKELINIISIFEKLERNINPIWSDLEKCMYVYKKICEYSTYSECSYNGRDASRNLLGLITGKSVCAGYAIIFKEMMDRLGIRCYYQNIKHDHSWNIIEIDGKFYGIDLTWDTCHKVNNLCGFRYFCRDNQKSFYADSHHSLKTEKEEKEYDLQVISLEVLSKMLSKISSERIHDESTIIKNGVEQCKLASYDIIINNNVPYIWNLNYSQDLYTYIRMDGSSFVVFPTSKEEDGFFEYVYLIYIPNERKVRATKIYSEMNLITKDKELRDNIANNLLSSSRVKNKINNFNGYVGYIGRDNKTRCYSPNIEESLGIYR